MAVISKICTSVYAHADRRWEYAIVNPDDRLGYRARVGCVKGSGAYRHLTADGVQSQRKDSKRAWGGGRANILNVPDPRIYAPTVAPV